APRLRDVAVPGQRTRRDAAAGRPPPGSNRGARARPHLAGTLCAGRRRARLVHRAAQRRPVPDDSPLPLDDVRGAGAAAHHRGLHAMIATAYQLLHLLLMLAAAPALTGLVRKVKALLLGRRGPPVLQPYRDLWRLLRKEAIVAESASVLFRVAP